MSVWQAVDEGQLAAGDATAVGTAAGGGAADSALPEAAIPVLILSVTASRVLPRCW